MSEAALSPLAERLGVEPGRLAPLAGYGEDQIARLDALVARAMQQEDEAFDASLEEALRFVPKLLRGRAAKLLFPGGDRG